MSEHEVVEERGDFRVRLEYDHDEEFPDFIESTVVPVSDRYLDFNDGGGCGPKIRDAWRDHTAEVIERWLRIFHDVRAVQQVNTRDTTYLILLTDDAAKNYGTPDGRMQECVDGDADTFRQWVEGDVWGWVIEKRVTWTTAEDYDDRDSWEEVESLWGMYGHEYAESEARAALAGHVGDEAA